MPLEVRRQTAQSAAAINSSIEHLEVMREQITRTMGSEGPSMLLFALQLTAALWILNSENHQDPPEVWQETCANAWAEALKMIADHSPERKT